MKRLTSNVVKPFGSIDSEIFWFGEAPGEEEDKFGEPFIGGAGQFMNRVFAKKRIIRSNYLFHNIFAQRPPRNNLGYFYQDKSRNKLTWEGEEHVERLRVWLEKILERKQRTGYGPNLLVALGRPALYHLTGKKRIYIWRGSVLPCTLVPGFKVYPTLHPSHVMRTMQEDKVKLQGAKKQRQQNALPLFEIDMDRIMMQKDFPDIRYPERKFDIDLSFGEAREKLIQLRDDPSITLISSDIETLPGGPEGPILWCVGFSPRPDYAFTIPFIKVQTRTFAWALDEEIELLRLISEIYLHPKKLKVFQGGTYDLAILGRYYGLRLGKGTWGDTMFCHQASYPYLWKRLETLTSIYTWEPYYKDEGRVSIGSRTDEAEFRYNCKDCAVTREIYPTTTQNARELRTYEGYKRTMSILPSHLAMTLRGIKIDVEKKEKLSKDFHQVAEEAKEFVQSKVGYDINLNSSDQKRKLLYGVLGLELQINRKTGKTTSDKNALNKLKRLYSGKEEGEIVAQILEYMKFSKLASTYADMNLDSDGRLRTAYSVVSTWRTNSSASPFGGFTKEDREGGNLQNIPKRTKDGLMVRRLFVADEGYDLVGFDRRQAEAMFVAWDSKDVRRIEMFQNNWDVHWYNAKLIFGIPDSVEYIPEAKFKNNITGEEFPLKDYRHIGKTIVHAGNYGMGPFKLQDILALQEFFLEFRECKEFLEIHKARNPLLLQWQREIREEVRATRTLISPIGRKREFMGRMNANLFNAAYAFKPQNYVGELTELTIQRVWEEIGDYFEILLNVHDELIGQVKKGTNIEKLKQDCIRLASFPVEIHGRVLDIPIDFKMGPNWADMKEI